MNIRTIKTNGMAQQTGPLMAEMVKKFSSDMIPAILMSAEEVFYLLARIPYHEDPPGSETLQRPYLTLSESGPGGDCDDKAIAMAAWAELNNIPWRFTAVRRAARKTLHHVFTELYIKGRWVPYDCTFAFNLPGLTPHYEERIVIWPRTKAR